jgi:hypothetical protein
MSCLQVKYFLSRIVCWMRLSFPQYLVAMQIHGLGGEL